ncbi:hypothetical protein LOB39_08390 [Lactobacillus delbrueckii subsp. sunkii]|uniref:Polysaccharide polymerase n=1 Tax=Lactobacillus delbrueckii subsp. allosunkii TaxID=1050107 RepID=A0ABD4SEY5_9LACO|nr:hypothetical protein [Lactobacillus delbrueckii]MCD5518575.1 hypothetical protein [Lactobacillus delbrueckii subsp. sunkii]MCT3476991.1 hypothetical protein [Lactobacillus delbrueckii subsp. lactis]
MGKSQALSTEKIFCGILFPLVLLTGLGNLAIFSNNTSFTFLQNVLQIPVYVLLVFLIIFKLLRQRITNKNIGIYFLAFLIGIILLWGYIQSRKASFFRAFLLILAAKGVDIKKILQVCRRAYVTSVVVGVTLFFLGISVGSQRRNFVSWGFVHPNVTGQIILLIVLLWIGEHSELPLKKISLISIIFGGGIYCFTGSRTAASSLISLAILLPLIKFFMKKGSCEWLCLVHPVFLLFTYISAAALTASKFLQFLDTIFVNRIFLNYYALSKFGINKFGQNVNLETTETVYNAIHNVWWSGTTVDSTYMTAILTLGIIPSIIWSAAYVYSMATIYKSKNYILFGIAIILCFEAFSETGMIDIYSSFILFCITAKIDEYNIVDTDQNHQKLHYNYTH